MTILNQWKIDLSIDEVLQAQGADPKIIKLRRPSLVENVGDGIKMGGTLIKPLVLYEKYPVEKYLSSAFFLPLSPRETFIRFPTY